MTIRLPQALAEHAGGSRELTLDVGVVDEPSRGPRRARAASPPPSGAGSRTRQVTIRRFVNVFVDENECRTLDGLDTTVPPGAVVYVIPSVAGG